MRYFITVFKKLSLAKTAAVSYGKVTFITKASNVNAFITI